MEKKPKLQPHKRSALTGLTISNSKPKRTNFGSITKRGRKITLAPVKYPNCICPHCRGAGCLNCNDIGTIEE